MNILSISSHHFHPFSKSKIFRTLRTILSCVVPVNVSADHMWELNNIEFRNQCMVENLSGCERRRDSLYMPILNYPETLLFSLALSLLTAFFF